MAERLAYLEAVVGADITQFRKGMRDIRNETGLLSETVGGLGRIGRTLTFSYTAPLLALGTFAVQAASKFDASMRNINAIAQLPIDQLDALSERTLAFGKNTRAGATAAADALYTVFSAGLTDAEVAFSAMEMSVRTAEAGLADVTTTTEALVAVMLSYGDTTEGFMQKASDSMTQMVAVGVGSMQDFASGMGKVIPTASALGMSIEELMGDMAFLTQRGLSASTASTSLNAALTSLIKPTDAMKAAFQSLGVDGAETLMEKFGGVNGGLKALIGTTDGTQASLQQLFNNIRGARAINQFANNIDAWDSSMAEFNATVEGATMRAWEQQAASFSATWDKMTSALEATAITIGNELIPIIKPMIEGFTNFLLSITELNPKLMTLGVAFTALSAILPPILWIMATLVNPIGLLIVGFGVLATMVGATLPGALAEMFPALSLANAHLLRLGEAITGLFTDTGNVNADDLLPDFTGSMSDSISRLIAPDSPISLWQAYEDSGYMDTMSWDEFMNLATEGGWEGGAISTANPITLDFEESMQTAMVSMLDMNEALREASNIEDLNPWERARARWEEFGNEAVTSFNEVWNVFVAGVAPMATTFMTSLSESIDGIDLFMLLPALQALFAGDFATMLDLLVPGMGSEAGSLFTRAFGTDFDFSALQASATGLWVSVGSFLKEEAVPALAEVAGYVAGRLGHFIVTGIQAGFAMLSGTGDAGQFLGEGVMTPFMDGFGTAMEDTGQSENPMNGLNGLLGMWALTFVLTGNTLIPIGVTIFTGLMTVISTSISLVSSAIAAFSLSGIIAGFTAFTSGLATAMYATWLTFTGGLTGSLGLAVGVAVGAAILGGIALGVGVYSLIPQEHKDAMFNGFWGFFNNMFRPEGADGFEVMLEHTITNLILQLGDAFSRFGEWITGRGDTAGFSWVQDIGLDTVIEPITGEEATQIQTDASDMVSRALDNLSPDGTNPMEVPIDWTVSESGQDILLSDLAGDMNIVPDGTDLGIMDAFEAQMIIEAENYVASPETEEAMANFVSNLSPTFDEEGNVTAEPFIEGYLIPLENAWLARFSADGTMMTSWVSFSGAVVTGMQMMGDEFLAFPTKAIPAMVVWASVVQTTMSIVEEAMADVNKQLVAMLWNVLQLEAGGLDVTVAIAGTDGSHQAGLNRVPYDGYTATLHKGERVLTAAEANDYDAVPNSVAMGGRSGSTTSNVNNNTISINGVQDADALLRELEQRGIYLE